VIGLPGPVARWVRSVAPERRHLKADAAAGLLTVLAGVLMLAAGILRLGRYVRFVSHSVMIEGRIEIPSLVAGLGALAALVVLGRTRFRIVSAPAALVLPLPC
jgi:hypothetical protein